MMVLEKEPMMVCGDHCRCDCPALVDPCFHEHGGRCQSLSRFANFACLLQAVLLFSHRHDQLAVTDSGCPGSSTVPRRGSPSCCPQCQLQVLLCTSTSLPPYSITECRPTESSAPDSSLTTQPGTGPQGSCFTGSMTACKLIHPS